MVIDFHYHYSSRKFSEAIEIQQAEKHYSTWARSAGIKKKKSIGELAQERICLGGNAQNILGL